MSARAPAARGRDDSNQGAIANTFRALGCTVHDTSAVGFGFPDLAIGLVGITELVECKTADGRPTPAQRTFTADWRGAPVRIVRSDDEAIALVQEIRRRAAGKRA